MAYTIKQVANFAGISIRTLHFYDEVGLIKPAYYGKNNYRYYEYEQLLLLQQVLFFRELGFELKDIKTILNSTHFNKVEALKIHRSILETNLMKTQDLIQTIDKTINHLERNTAMFAGELYGGNFKEQFLLQRKAVYLKFLTENRFANAEQLKKINDHLSSWQAQDWQKIDSTSNFIHQALRTANTKNISVSDQEVQQLIKQHYELIKNFFTPCPEIYGCELYVALGKLYREHPVLNKTLGSDLAMFLSAGMTHFAEQLNQGEKIIPATIPACK